jgi:hypothetical protein
MKIIVLPSHVIIKSVFDDNITSSPSIFRTAAFDKTADLTTLANVDMMIDSVIFERHADKLTEERRRHLELLFKVNRSTFNLPEYSENLVKSLGWIAESLSQDHFVVIICDNHQEYKFNGNGRIVAYPPQEYLARISQAEKSFERGLASELTDALRIRLFDN